MIQLGKERFRGFEVIDDSGDVLLSVEMLPDGNVFLEARVYNKQGKLVMLIDDRGAQELGGAELIIRAGPPG